MEPYLWNANILTFYRSIEKLPFLQIQKLATEQCKIIFYRYFTDIFEAAIIFQKFIPYFHFYSHEFEYFTSVTDIKYHILCILVLQRKLLQVTIYFT